MRKTMTPLELATQKQLRLAGKKILMGVLVDLGEGETLTYQDIQTKTSLDVSTIQDRAAVIACITKVQRDFDILFETVRGVGYKKLHPSDVVENINLHVNRTQKKLGKLKKRINVGLTDRYYARLSNEEKRELYRKASAVGAISLGMALGLPKPSSRHHETEVKLPALPPSF